MPPAAMHHAMMAPNGPVALPKVRGREKIPEPTMLPTTIAVRANRDSFCTEDETDAVGADEDAIAEEDVMVIPPGGSFGDYLALLRKRCERSGLEPVSF